MTLPVQPASPVSSRASSTVLRDYSKCILKEFTTRYSYTKLYANSQQRNQPHITDINTHSANAKITTRYYYYHHHHRLPRWSSGQHF